MKRTISAFLAAALCLSFTGCSQDPDTSSSLADTQSITTTASSKDGTEPTDKKTKTDSDSSSDSDAAKNKTTNQADSNTEKRDSAPTESTTSSISKPDEASLRQLVEQNFYYVDICILVGLPTKNDPVRDQLYPVDSAQFPTMQALNDFLGTVYTQNTVRAISAAYQDIDGTLCMDDSRIGTKGSLVEWDGYQVKIGNLDGETLHFTLTAQTDNGETLVPYSVDATAVCKDGNWLLESTIF